MWVTLGLLAVIFALIWQRLQHIYSTFHRLGIRGPKPKLIVGNFLDIYGEGKDKEEVYKEWINKYGPVVGYFEGLYPVLLVADPDVLQQILQSKFSNFVDRPLRDSFDAGKRGDIFTALGNQWRRLRTIINPIFSPSNITSMTPIVKQKLDLLMVQLRHKSESQESVDMLDIFECLTMDVIADAVYGINLESLVQGSHPFVTTTRGLNQGVFKIPLPMVLLRGLPPLLKKVCFIFFIIISKLKGRKPPEFTKHLRNLEEFAKDAVEERLANPLSESEHPDILGLMLKYAQEGVTEDDLGAQKKTMTMKEVSAQCYFLLLAGFGSSSLSLAMTVQCLVTNPEVQQKLYEEILHLEQELENPATSPSYDKVMKLEYLDQVIQETLRLYPPTPFATKRSSEKEMLIKLNGKTVSLPAGLDIQLDTMSLHTSPSLWHDPLTFDPERFRSEAKTKLHNFQYLPFSAGPRNCPGQRFAMMEMKLALVKILKEFKIEKCVETQMEPKFQNGITRAPTSKIMVQLTSRE